LKDFFADLNQRLSQVPFVAGERYFPPRTSRRW